MLSAWTSSEFEVGAIQLAHVLTRHSKHRHNENDTFDCCWTWRNDSKSLEHHHSRIMFGSNATATAIDTDTGTTTTSLLHNPNDILEDDSIWCDEDAIVVHEPADADADSTSRSQWYFCVVYNDTWCVPVLYFTVQDLFTGQPWTRSAIVEHLLLTNCQEAINTSKDTWEFVSATEHPVWGTPCFFLHPCQTNDRLQTMMAAGTQLWENPATRLWSWFSMLLPSAGLPLSPCVYLEVQQLLLNKDNNHKS